MTNSEPYILKFYSHITVQILVLAKRPAKDKPWIKNDVLYTGLYAAAILMSLGTSTVSHKLECFNILIDYRDCITRV